jgi:hypothetical protein
MPRVELVMKKTVLRSDRVKTCDLHPTEPWMLASLYNGNVHVWNHESQTLVNFQTFFSQQLFLLKNYFGSALPKLFFYGDQ